MTLFRCLRPSPLFSDEHCEQRIVKRVVQTQSARKAKFSRFEPITKGLPTPAFGALSPSPLSTGPHRATAKQGNRCRNESRLLSGGTAPEYK